MTSSGTPKSSSTFTLLGALLFGAGVGYLALSASSNGTSDLSANSPVTSQRLKASSVPTKNPNLLYYFTNCENPHPPSLGFPNPAERQRHIQDQENKKLAQIDAQIALLRKKFNQLKGTPEGAAEIEWAKGITNWGIGPRGPEVHDRKKLAFMLWLDEDPRAALIARGVPSAAELYLFVEDHQPAKVLGLEGLSEKQTESLLSAFVSRKGADIFDHIADINVMMLRGHKGNEQQSGSSLAYNIGNNLPTSDRSKLIEHAAEFPPSVIDDMADYMAKRLDAHSSLTFLDQIWRKGVLAIDGGFHSRTRDALRKLWMQAYDLPVQQRFEGYMEHPDPPKTWSGWSAERGRAGILDIELQETFLTSERNFLHEYQAGTLDAEQILSEIEKIRPDLDYFPEAAIQEALFHKLSEIDSSSAISLIEGMPPKDRRRIVDHAIHELLNTGIINNDNITGAVELSPASPVSSNSFSSRHRSYDHMLERALKDMPAPMLTNWVGTLPSSTDRDLLAGILATRLDAEETEMKNQAESLIESNEFLTLYQSGQLNPKR